MFEFKGLKTDTFRLLLERMNEMGAQGWDSAGIMIKDNDPYDPYYLAIMKRQILTSLENKENL